MIAAKLLVLLLHSPLLAAALLRGDIFVLEEELAPAYKTVHEPHGTQHKQRHDPFEPLYPDSIKPETVHTDPKLSDGKITLNNSVGHSKSSSCEGSFDWMTNNLYELWFKTNAGVVNHNVRLPYFDNGGPASILNTGDDRDIQESDGWTLVYQDFGTQEEAAVIPLFMLYNKYRGVLRFFFYNTRFSDFTYSRVVMSQPFANKASPIFNFGQQETFLDTFDQSVMVEAIAKTAWWQWSYVDFAITGYDPTPEIDASLLFDITGISESDVIIEGSLSLDQVLARGTVGGSPYPLPYPQAASF